MLKAVAWGPRLLKHSSGVQCTCRNTSSGVHAETQWSIKADHQNATQCCKNTKKTFSHCRFRFATQFGGLTMSSRHTDTALKCNRMPPKHQTNCKLKVVKAERHTNICKNSCSKSPCISGAFEEHYCHAYYIKCTANRVQSLIGQVQHSRHFDFDLISWVDQTNMLMLV